MSTEQSLDPQLIEQTKQQIRSLVSEIAQLSKEDISPEEFYGQFLTRVVSALAAIGGAVWTTDSSFVYIPMVDAQAYFQLPERVNAIEITVEDPERIGRYRGELQARLGPEVRLVDWQQLNSHFFAALQVGHSGGELVYRHGAASAYLDDGERVASGRLGPVVYDDED